MGVRPRILLNFASSLDGKITLAPGIRKGSFVMSREQADHRRMREIRAEADAILIGASNLRADDPSLGLAKEERERRRSTGELEPYRIVLTRMGTGVLPDRRMFDPSLGGPSVVVHAGNMPSQLRDRLSKVARLVPLGSTSVDVPQMLEWLATSLGVHTLLCEGGGVIAAELFAARAVDSLYLTLVPRILGGADAPSLATGRGFLPDEIPDAKLEALERIGDELFLRYDFTWPEVE